MLTDDEKLREIIGSITKIARADGKITEEEAEILENVQINLLMYDDYLNEAMEDGIIDDDEMDMLIGLKQNIIAEAWDIAQVSDGVSDDELKMLEVLLQNARKV